MIVNANSIVQHVTQNKNGITIYVNVNARLFLSVKKIIIAHYCRCTLMQINAHVFVKIVSI